MKEFLKKVKMLLLDPRLLVCVGIAWLITNGWAYAALGVGTYYGITPLISIAGIYLAILWSPFCLEGIFTAVIAVALMKRLFPKDKQALVLLEEMQTDLREKKAERRVRRHPADVQDTEELIEE